MCRKRRLVMEQSFDAPPMAPQPEQNPNEDQIARALAGSAMGEMRSTNDFCWRLEEPVLSRAESAADIAKAA